MDDWSYFWEKVSSFIQMNARIYKCISRSKCCSSGRFYWAEVRSSLFRNYQSRYHTLPALYLYPQSTIRKTWLTLHVYICNDLDVLFPFSVMSSSCSFSMLWSPGCRYTRLYMSTKIVHFPWNLFFFFFFYIASQKRFVFLFFIFLFSMKRYPRF